MYIYKHPKPIIIKLTDDWGWEIRNKAAAYSAKNLNRTGAERGSSEEQGFGALAEIVIRSKLGLPEINPEEHPLAYDLLLPSGVKVDVKCRGGVMPFKEEYESSDGIAREAKHNFFARQVFDDTLDTDIYLMTHLETPNGKAGRSLPGTRRQKKWVLYVCGWVSKNRVAREGVYLERGSLTEQGRTWFTYRGQEIEYYNINLNGIETIEDILSIEKANVEEDKKAKGKLNVTSVDAIRMAYDLVGRDVLRTEQITELQNKLNITKFIKPILSQNQYFHFVRWLIENGIATNKDLTKLSNVMKEEPYSGI
jgi:hypothetical protein